MFFCGFFISVEASAKCDYNNHNPKEIIKNLKNNKYSLACVKQINNFLESKDLDGSDKQYAPVYYFLNEHIEFLCNDSGCPEEESFNDFLYEHFIQEFSCAHAWYLEKDRYIAGIADAIELNMRELSSKKALVQKLSTLNKICSLNTEQVSGLNKLINQITQNKMFVYSKDGFVNVREQPSINAKILKKFNNGISLITGRFIDNWCQVELDNGQIGYIHKSGLKGELN